MRDDGRARIAHPSTDSIYANARSIDRSIDESVVFIDRSHHRDRRFDRAIGRSMAPWMNARAPRQGTRAPHPSLDVYRQTIHIYTTIDRSSIKYRERQTHENHHPRDPAFDFDVTRRRRRRRRFLSTLECRRRDAGLERRPRNERTLLSRLGR